MKRELAHPQAYESPTSDVIIIRTESLVCTTSPDPGTGEGGGGNEEYPE